MQEQGKNNVTDRGEAVSNFQYEMTEVRIKFLSKLWKDVKKGDPSHTYFVIDDVFIHDDKDGNVQFHSMGIANRLTILDILLKVNTDNSFREEFYKTIWDLQVSDFIKVYDAAKIIALKEWINNYKPTPKEKGETVVYTYLMHDETTGYYKIGRSINVEYREQTLSAQVPKIKTLCYTSKDIERELHNKYMKYHVRGEWFNLPQSEVDFIHSLFKKAA